MSKLILQYNEGMRGGELKAMNDKAQWASHLTAWDYHDGKYAYAYISNTAKKGEYAFMTGYYFVDADEDVMYIQTTDSLYLIQPLNGEQDWERGKRTVELAGTPVQSQSVIDTIIKNNIQIVQNNLVCARYAEKFTKEQQQQIRDLQNRVMNRQEALKQSGLCENVKSSHPKGYSDLGGYLDKLMKGEGVGIATWAIVVISAVVIAATSVAAYYAYKKLAEESKQDVKYSKELMKVLQSKLTPQEYEQLMKETQGIVTKAKIKASIGGFAGSFKWLAAIVGGYAIYKVVKNNL